MLETQPVAGSNKLTWLLETLSTALSRTLFLSPMDCDPEIWAASFDDQETSHPRPQRLDQAAAPVALKKGTSRK